MLTCHPREGGGLLLGLTDDVDCAVVEVAPAAPAAVQQGGEGDGSQPLPGFAVAHTASIPALAYITAGASLHSRSSVMNLPAGCGTQSQGQASSAPCCVSGRSSALCSFHHLRLPARHTWRRQAAAQIPAAGAAGGRFGSRTGRITQVGMLSTWQGPEFLAHAGRVVFVGRAVVCS